MGKRFLYVIAATLQGPVKLGISGDPEQRLRELQTGHVEPLHLYYTEPIDADRSLLERLLHRDIIHHRQRGEWFRLPVEDAIRYIQFTIIHYDLEPDLRRCLGLRR